MISVKTVHGYRYKQYNIIMTHVYLLWARKGTFPNVPNIVTLTVMQAKYFRLLNLEAMRPALYKTETGCHVCMADAVNKDVVS